MSYILTIVLFSGAVSTQQFSTVQECNRALYDAMDQLLVKNIQEIECKVFDSAGA